MGSNPTSKLDGRKNNFLIQEQSNGQATSKNILKRLHSNIIKMPFFPWNLGILQDTTGTYDTGPWSTLRLDAIDTFMDYYTVIYGPTSFNYSLTYGYDVGAFPAICVYGKNLIELSDT